MLVQLAIRDFTIVQTLDVELGGGFTALTGETGAGKSILVDALMLALGERASSEVVRPGRPRAEITAVFDVAGNDAVLARLDELELGTGERECIVRRVIAAEGGSRGFVNGTPVALQTLRSVVGGLVEVHGQHAHHALLRRERQREILDEVGGHRVELERVREAYRQVRELEEERARLLGGSGEREPRLDFLRFQLREIDDLGLRAGEIEDLLQSQRRLARADELAELFARVESELSGEDGADVLSVLARMRGAIEPLIELDPRLGSVHQMLGDAVINIEESVSTIRGYARGIEIEPDALATVERRLSSIHDLARKHRVRAGELAGRAEALRTELDALEDSERRLRALDETLGAARGHYDSAARELTRRRRASAPELAAAITRLLASLGLPGGALTITVTESRRGPEAGGAGSAPAPNPNGVDIVEFQVRTNAGQRPGPLSRVASGGELSRVSLAIHVAGADRSGAPTLVFDEVDVGIGGGVAEQVGRRLREVGQARQVLCITHLPQVAAQAGAHIRVRKKVSRSATKADLLPVSGEDRVDEIARMLGGVDITEQTLAHAREMLERNTA